MPDFVHRVERHMTEESARKSTRRPKLAIVNQGWNPAVPPVTAGSVAIWVYEVARRLLDEYDVTVYSRTVSGEPLERTADGVRYSRRSNWPTPFSSIGRLLLNGIWRSASVPDVGQPGYFAAYHRRIARAIARYGADVVHVQNLGQAACAVRRAHPQSRIVLHMHCEWLSQLSPELVREWIEASDLILGCSRYITNTIVRAWPAFASRCATLYNAVDTVAFEPGGAARSLGASDDEIILFVGRITPEKGLHVLIQSFDAVLERRPRARLIIAGPESVTPLDYLVGVSTDESVRNLDQFYTAAYPEMLKQMISARARDRVQFVGPLPHDVLPQWYRGAEVLVNPSLSESFGMTVLEAMACGVPAVVTATGGMPEVVDNGRYGTIVEPGSVEQLADAIVQLLEDPDRRKAVGTDAAKFVRAAFSWERIRRDALALYARVRAT